MMHGFDWSDLSEESGEILRVLLEGTPEEKVKIISRQKAAFVIWRHGVVSQYAYRQWERAGRPEGRDDEFWIAGETEWENEQW